MSENLGTIRANLAINIKDFLKMIKSATSGTDKMSEEVQESLEVMSDATENGFKNMRGFAVAFGTGLAGAGAIVTKHMFDITSQFKESEKSMRKFSAQTGIVGDELKGFKDKIEGTWLKGYGEDVEEVASAYSGFQRELKLSAKETELLTEKAFQLRDVFGYEIEDSLSASTSLIKNFGIDGTKSFDLITFTAQKAGDRAGDLLDTVNEYSKDFVKAGYSADEMFNLLIGGINAGIMDFDKIGDTVKEFGNVLLQSGDDGITIMKEVTGSTKKANQIMKDLADGTLSVEDAMKLTVEGLAKMDDKVQQNQIGASLFGSLWEEAGIKGLEAMVNADGATKGFEGTLAKANDTLKGQDITMEQVKRQWETATNLIGKELAPILTEILKIASKVILKFLEFAKSNPMIAKIIALAGVLVGILGTLSGAIIAIGAFLPSIIIGIEFLGTVIAGIGAIVATVGGVILSLPVLIGIAIVALIALIIWKWDEIKAFSIMIWTAIVNFILSVPQLISDAWVAFVDLMIVIWEGLKTKTINTWNGLLNFIKSIPSILYNFFTSTLPFVIGFIIGSWIKMSLMIGQKSRELFTVIIPNLVKKFWAFLQSIFTTYIPILLSKIALFVIGGIAKFQKFKTDMIQKAKDLFVAVALWISKLPSKITSFKNKLKSSAITLGLKMIDGLKDLKKNLPKTIKDAVLNAIKGIGKLGSQAYSALKNIGSSMWKGFKKGLGINSPSYLEEAMFDIGKAGEDLNQDLYKQFRGLQRLPKVNSLAELAKDNKQTEVNNNNNSTIQNFNSPLINMDGADKNTANQTAYSLYDMITFRKRAMGVNI